MSVSGEINTPFPVFYDLDGRPLDGGFIYIGTSGLDPETNPINIFWDKALTIPASQPVKTQLGYPFRSGSPSSFFVGVSDFSITVKDNRGQVVVTNTNAISILPSLVSILSDGSDANNGDKLVAVHRTLTGAGSTDLHEWIEGKVVDVKTDFLAKADDSTDDTSKLLSAIATGKTVYLGGSENIYVTSGTLELAPNQVIFSDGATLKTNSDAPVLKLKSGSVAYGINFLGSGKASGKTSQDAILIDGGAGLDSATGSRVSRCGFKNMGGSGYRVTRVVDTHMGSLLEFSNFDGCAYGINIDDRGEYTQVNMCGVTNNTVGIRIQGGNSAISKCNVTNNDQHGFLIVSGTNDAHGMATDCLVNHNTQFSVKVEAITVPDFSFHNCKFYYGNIWLYRCSGVRFYGCTIDTSVYVYEQGATDCLFSQCKFVGPSLLISPNYSGEASRVFYTDCEWPSNVAPTSAARINGAYSEMKLINPSNIVVPNGDGYIFNWDSTVYNSLDINTTYTLHNLWDSTNKYWDFTLFAAPNANLMAELQIQISAGGGSASPDNFDIYLYDVLAGRRVGSFSAGVAQSSWRIYSFNGNVSKGKIQIRIDNKTGGNVTVFRDQGGSVPCFGVAQGW